MQIQGYNFPEGLKYDKNHFWSKLDGDILTMGFNEFAVRLAGEFVYVDMVEPGKKVEQGKAFMSAESGKWVGRVYAPVDGEVVEFNADLEFEPDKINQDPYGEGWLVKIKIAEAGQLGALMDPESLEPWFLSELERVKGDAED